MATKNESNRGDSKGWGIQFFVACASEHIELNGITYTRKEFVELLSSSGLAEKIIISQSGIEQSFTRIWWDNIQLSTKLDRPGKRKRKISKEKTDLFNWIRDEKIDPNLSLNKLMELIDKGMANPPARTTVNKYLPELRKKRK